MEPEEVDYENLLDREDLHEWANEIVMPYYEDNQEAIQQSLLTNDADATYRAGLIIGAMLALWSVEGRTHHLPQPGVN